MRFIIALWVSKLYLFLVESRRKIKSDRIGLLAARICPNFLEKIKKPEMVILVTGTNGKTTTTSIIANTFKNIGKKTVYNYWGANQVAGHIRSLLETVNIFNKSIVDVCVLECDEITTRESIPAIKPNYIIITNLCRDSIRRNAYPDYIYNILMKSLDLDKDTKIILNSMDPLSFSLGENNKKIYVEVQDILDYNSSGGVSPEFITCPKCNEFVEYDYRHYRHIGKFHCPKCGYTNPKGDYKLTKKTKNDIVINSNSYPIISDRIFDIYNEAMLVSLFLDIGYKPNEIKKALCDVKIPVSRGGFDSYKGNDIYRICGKAQNGSAPSTMFELIMRNTKKKQLIMLLDEEIYYNAQDTITWLYDNDFEVLNDPSINKIIISGRRAYDFQLRLLLAGVPSEKIIISKDYNEAHNYIDINGDDLYVIHDIDSDKEGISIVNNIKGIIDEVSK